MKIEIEIPDGHEIDVLTFKKSKNKLPETWEEYEKERPIGHQAIGIFKTIQQAQAVKALGQLSELMHVYNDGWTPDWTDETEVGCIYFDLEKIRVGLTGESRCFLAFKNEQTAKLFVKNFSDLIEQAKPLL